METRIGKARVQTVQPCAQVAWCCKLSLFQASSLFYANLLPGYADILDCMKMQLSASKLETGYWHFKYELLGDCNVTLEVSSVKTKTVLITK
jgi:hypothetical protein